MSRRPSEAPHPRLGGLSARAFLARHWQKRPLLVRGAFPDWADPLSPDELAGLATEPDAHARIVEHTRRAPRWRVRWGPFDAADFAALPERDWTLLVRHVDAHVPGAAALLEDFRFVPAWRLDDVMVSYAAPGGSVGPHLDSYDVFLIQGFGRRRWRVDSKPVGGDPGLVPGLDLQVLARFAPDREWVLEPGDLLYLPPRIAHHGVAEGPCMTYSVGFRAPAPPEIIAGVLEAAVAAADAGHRYADPDLKVPRSPGRIAPGAVAWARRVVREALGAPGVVEDWFGRHVTEGPADDDLAPLPWRTLRARVAAGRPLVRAPGCRLAYLETPRGVTLFAAGEANPLPARLAPLARLLCDADPLPGAALAPFLADPEGAALLRALGARGVLARP